MIEYLPFLTIAPILALALASPGPDFMLVSTMALSRGRQAGIQSAAGIATGILIYAGLSLWGVSALFERMAFLMIGVKVLGGLYLFYLGVQLWRSTLQTGNVSEPSTPAAVSLSHPYKLGFLTSMTNPKSMAFFASIFAIAVTGATSAPTKIITALLCAVMALGWFGFVAIALSSPKIRARYQRARKTIDRVAGSVLMLFGIKLVASARS